MDGARCAVSAAVPAPVFRCWLILFLAAELCTVHHAGALEISAPEELLVENGAYAQLPCTFKSSDVTSSTTSITWAYIEEGASSAGTVIYHYIGGKQYPGQQPHLKDRITWVGDIINRDGSIRIDKITFKDTGTYTCAVMNPPDISGVPKQIKLRVVETERVAGESEISAPEELVVENGAYAQLPCTFKSSAVTSSTTSITWTYVEEGASSAGTVIYHYIGGKQYPGRQPHLKDRVTWAGDIINRDGSIKIDKVTFKDNGTYSCAVVNPPDAFVTPKQIKLRVVETERVAGESEISAPEELLVENGTYAQLPCTFKSSAVTSSTTSITWMYIEEGASSAGTVIYHYIGGKQYPGRQPHLKDRITWAGDIINRDGSIKIDKITFKDTGTYTCAVVNPPDAFVTPKQIKLRVVETE